MGCSASHYTSSRTGGKSAVADRDLCGISQDPLAKPKPPPRPIFANLSVACAECGVACTACEMVFSDGSLLCRNCAAEQPAPPSEEKSSVSPQCSSVADFRAQFSRSVQGSGIECSICMNDSVMVEMRPCGHRVACLSCANKMQSCPICRANIVERVSVIGIGRSQNRYKSPDVQMSAYARYLGIDTDADHDLLWIAVESLEAPLPAYWSEHFDNLDRVFYYNSQTHVSSWTHPLEHAYREMYATIADFRHSDLSPMERAEKLDKVSSECEQLEQEVDHQMRSWAKHRDEGSGEYFYFNAKARESTWTDPRPAQQDTLYLKLKLVRFLFQDCSRFVVDASERAAAARHGQEQEQKSHKVPSQKTLPADWDVAIEDVDLRDMSSFEPTKKPISAFHMTDIILSTQSI